MDLVLVVDLSRRLRPFLLGLSPAMVVLLLILLNDMLKEKPE
jgi:hypothetical protein